MRNLRIWQKLLVMGTVFMLPFAVMTYTLVSSVNAIGIEFARQEMRGLEYCSPLRTLLHNLQQHRGMSAGWRGGDASFKERLGAKGADIENDIRRVDEVDRRLNGALHVGKKWTALSAASRDLLADREESSVESFTRHTKVIGDAITLITDVGDVSNLTLDPDLDSYYLMNAVVFQAPEVSEALTQARGLGVAVAVGRQGTPEQFDRLHQLSILAGYLGGKLNESIVKAVTFNGTLKPATEAYRSTGAGTVQDAASYVAKVAASRRVDTSAADYYAAITPSADAVFEIGDQASGLLDGLLRARVARFERDMLTMLAWVAFGLVVVAIVGVLIVRDITVTLGRVVSTANRIATGDLTMAATSETRKDEIGVLARGFNDMIGALASLVGQLRQSGIQVNASVTEIATSARDQQATAVEIAATTSEIGATSREIAATSRELVRTMAEVSTVAERTATLAGNGQAGLTRMAGTMRQVMEGATAMNAKLAVLDEKAGNITQVVTTITRVADQANLLSLNAAVEAEKAGQYGRGFAVVATEIRRLADQTAVATHDIGLMVREIQASVFAGVISMDSFYEQVRRGMLEIQQVGGQLSEIIQQVQVLAPRLGTVSEGMETQAVSAEQITQALSQLSQAAHETVQSLRHSSEAIEGLNQAATGMRNGVSRFTLAA
jgi:methyl-accepting chemotaxis protein